VQVADGKSLKSYIFQARIGHALLSNGENALFLFGGFGGLLKEKNDLWMFNFDENKWGCIDKGFDFEHQRRTMLYKKKSLLLEKIRFDLVKEDD
jgi:hypothetical protein